MGTYEHKKFTWNGTVGTLQEFISQNPEYRFELHNGTLTIYNRNDYMDFIDLEKGQSVVKDDDGKIWLSTDRFETI